MEPGSAVARERQLTAREAVEHLRRRFPFEHYTDALEATYFTVAEVLLRHLSPGDRVLDFGSGPCDKTAVAQALGFRSAATDDLQDDWHSTEGTRDKILDFARQEGIDFRLAEGHRLAFDEPVFDLVMMHDVLEHLHDSPRHLINDLLALTKPDGLFFATVPNAVNIRKRLDVLRGRTNLPNFEGFYWYPGPWRGHIREYTLDDLRKLCGFLGLDILELDGVHHMLRRLPRGAEALYRAVTAPFPGLRDSLLVVARKKPGWRPVREMDRDALQAMFGRLPNCPHYGYGTI